MWLANSRVSGNKTLRVAGRTVGFLRRWQVFEQIGSLEQLDNE